MLRSHGCERAAMYRMYGQVISSRHNLSNYIHVGNAAITWMWKSSDVQDVRCVSKL